MKCFIHNNQDSLGTCKYCNKGICQNCMVDTGMGLACKDDNCKNEVRFLNDLIENNKKIYSKMSKNSLIPNLYTLIFGLIFLGFHFFIKNDIFILAIGSFLLAFSILQYFYTKKYVKSMKTNFNE
ncbi:MAG: Unknown protein [uncultured Campylobacterales bacterium]|uniref:B box-type domain-containing protein n=1 Tax=uncultured Campylobacterales bacterium TaxID=352960 RepID=A0A6S6T427_9BACT|nr:MAG: Unknown protein [uncultured Campylobacterales bacterium]